MQAHDPTQADRSFACNGQAEATAWADRTWYPVKCIEYAFAFQGWDTRPVVNDFDNGSVIVRQKTNRYLTAIRRVFQGIL